MSGRRRAATASVLLLAAAAGAAVALVGGTAPVLVLGLVGLGLAGWAAARRLHAGREASPAHLLVGAGVLLTTMNGIRAGSAVSAADVVLIAACVAIPLASGAAILRVWRPYVVVIPGLLFVCGLLTTLLAGAVVADVVIMGQLVYTYALVPVVIGYAAMSAPGRTVVVAAFLLGVVANVSVAAADSLGAGVAAQVTGLGFVGRSAGLTTHPNTLGLLGVLALPLGWWAHRSADGVLLRALGMVAIAAAVAAVALSGSRAAAVGVVVSLAIHWLLASRHERALNRSVPLLAVSAAIGVAIIVALRPDAVAVSIDRLTGAVSVDASDAERLVLYEAAIADFASSPLLGVGYAGVRAAHNIYLQFLESAGVIGFLLWVGYLVATMRLALAVSVPGSARAAAYLAIACASGLGGWLAFGFAQNALYDRFLMVPVGLLLGLAARDAVVARRPATANAARGGTRRRIPDPPGRPAAADSSWGGR